MQIIGRDAIKTFYPTHSKNLQKHLQQQSNDVQINLWTSNLNDIVTDSKQTDDKISLNQDSLIQSIPKTLSTKRSSKSLPSKKSQQISLKETSIVKQSQTLNQFTDDSKYPKTALEVKQLIQKHQQQIQEYIKNHRFYQQKNFSLSSILKFIQTQLSISLEYAIKLQIPSVNSQANKSNGLKVLNSIHSSHNNLSSPHHQHLYQLSLYLNKQTNKQIFLVYEYILQSGKSGISYESLAKKLKTDIINISHYCCKLKKIKFIEWQHKKQGIIVYPKIIGNGNQQKNSNKKNSHNHQLSSLPQISLSSDFNYSQSFVFLQLTLTQNILLNLSSASSILHNGLTNQQIKFRIMKHAQNKMIRRTVEGMKNIQKTAQRQGKVFQFKYKKQTKIIRQELDKQRLQNSQIIELTQNCRDFLNTYVKQSIKDKIPLNLKDQPLLLQLINTKLTSYFSSIGIKQSKRQCTPLKLNRFILVLNKLQEQAKQNGLGGLEEYELRRYIIDTEKQSINSMNGIIHKRTMIGILQGLKQIQLIEQFQSCYYSKWVSGVKRRQKIEHFDEDLDFEDLRPRNGRKILKIDNQSSEKVLRAKKHFKFQKVKMITQKQHLTQIFTELLNLTFNKALIRMYRKAFHRVMYVHRKKQTVPGFISEKNIFHFLNDPFNPLYKPLTEHSTNFQSFTNQIDNFIESDGKKLENFPDIDYQIVKYIRRNPMKKQQSLRSKYGRNWIQKFQILSEQGVINLNQNGYETSSTWKQFLV